MISLSTFSSQNFQEIFDQIIEQKISENEIKKFLLALNEADLPSNAFIGAVNALQEKMKRISAPQNAIDVCGTGGDGLNSLNISTAVCFVISAAGIPVAKHGNKAISSNSGSADIFSELGIEISSNLTKIEEDLHQKNLCFLFAPFFHQSLANLAKIRKSLAVPTIFNFLGPLLNPAKTNFQLIGVSKKTVMRKMANVITKNSQNSKNTQRTYIVHGFDGMDEISLSDNSYLLHCENGQIFEEEIINPEKFGFEKKPLSELAGSNPKYNAKKLIELLDGKKSAYRDIVILNSAFVFKLSGKVKEIFEGIELAKSMIDGGKALGVLNSIKSQ